MPTERFDGPFAPFAFQVAFRPQTGSAFGPVAGMDPLISGGFSEITGLEASMEAKAIREGGRNYGVHQRPGQVTFATVVLKRGLMRSRHLWRWWSFWAGADGAANGGWSPAGRCDVTIELWHEGQPALNWRLANAMPVKFRAGDLNARGTDVAIEELHLAHEGLHMGEVT